MDEIQGRTTGKCSYCGWEKEHATYAEAMIHARGRDKHHCGGGEVTMILRGWYRLNCVVCGLKFYSKRRNQLGHPKCMNAKYMRGYRQREREKKEVIRGRDTGTTE